MPMAYPSLPFGAFLGALLVLIPLPWHWRARNIGTLAIIAWLFVMNLIYAINSLIWTGNVSNNIPVWCDITTKLIIGANTALPIATMCVCKHLEFVSSNRRVRIDHIDKRRRIIFDSIMCFGVPLIFMALHYVVQGHRYDIVENFGCQPATYYSVPAVMIVWFPPLFFSLATLVYASIALYHFIRRRISFAAHLQNSNSALTTHRYMRLMAMAITEIVWGTALTSYNIYNNIQGGLRPWISWANVHSNFSRVDLYAFLEIGPVYLKTMFLFWWAMPASAFIFFLFFGFGEEARKEYSKVITLFRRHVLRQAVKKDTVFGSSFPSSRNVRPVHIATLPSIHLSDEKSFNTRSTSPVTPVKIAQDDVESFSGRKLALSTLSYQDHPMPSPSAYSLDAESGRRVSTSDEHFPEPRAFTHSIIVEAGPSPSSYYRPFSPPSICPVIPHAEPHDNDGVLVTVQTIRHQGDEMV